MNKTAKGSTLNIVRSQRGHSIGHVYLPAPVATQELKYFSCFLCFFLGLAAQGLCPSLNVFPYTIPRKVDCQRHHLERCHLSLRLTGRMANTACHCEAEHASVKKLNECSTKAKFTRNCERSPTKTLFFNFKVFQTEDFAGKRIDLPENRPRHHCTRKRIE